MLSEQIDLGIYDFIGDEIKLMWKKKELSVAAIILLFIGVSLDLYYIYHNPIISVKIDYIYYIFAAHSTIAAISATILTVVVNSQSSEYFGYSIKEITNFKNDYLSISYAIPLSLFSILISSAFLAIEFLNSIITIMIIIVVLISYLSEFSWRLLSNDEFCEKMVLEHIEMLLKSNSHESIENLIKREFESLNAEIYRNGIGYIDKHLNLITDMMKRVSITSPLSQSLERNIKKTFDIVTAQIGFIPAIDKILELYKLIDVDRNYYNIQDILRTPIMRIQFQNDSELHSSGFLEVPNGLENNNILNDKLKVMILYSLFTNIYTNEIISSNIKQDMLNRIVFNISTFSWKETKQYESVKQRSLLYIFKDYVLLNKNIVDSKRIFSTIVKSLYSDGVSSNERLFETIALIYLSLYFYSEIETETLSYEHREKLRSLFGSYEDDIHTSNTTFKTILNEYFSEITKTILNKSTYICEEFSFLEYFPPQFGAKALVWQKNAGITFAMYNYLLSEFIYNVSPTKMILDWDKIEDKIYYIKIMLDFFDPLTMKLKEANQIRLKQISELTGRHIFLNDSSQARIFEELKEEMRNEKLKELANVQEVDPNIGKLNELLVAQITKRNMLYGYNTSIILDEDSAMHFRPYIDEKVRCYNDQSVVDIIINYFKNFINYHVKKTLPEIQINFEAEGVSQLLETLKIEKYDTRNYTYFDDWKFNDKVKESTNFIELTDMIKDIKIENTSPINTHVFFKRGCLDYNFELTDNKVLPLTDEECFNYIENFKIAEGLYNINDSYCKVEEAIEMVRASYRKVMISFRFKSNIAPECGIRVVPIYDGVIY